MDIAAADWEPKAKKIDRLTVKNISGDRVLDVRFGHSYLGTVVGNPEHADHREREQTALNCRLLLDKISIFRNNGELDRNYVFSYNMYVSDNAAIYEMDGSMVLCSYLALSKVQQQKD